MSRRRSTLAMGIAAGLASMMAFLAPAQAAAPAPMTCPASACSGRQASYAEQAILLGQDYRHTRARSARWWRVADSLVCNSRWKAPLLGQSSRTPRTGDGVSYAVALLQGAITTWPGIPRLTVDGRYGPRTAAAVRAWQRTHGHAATGRMNAATWAHFRVRYCDPG